MSATNSDHVPNMLHGNFEFSLQFKQLSLGRTWLKVFPKLDTYTACHAQPKSMPHLNNLDVVAAGLGDSFGGEAGSYYGSAMFVV